MVDPFVLLSEKLNMVIILSSRQSWIDQKVAIVVFFLSKQVLHFLKSSKQMIAPVDCLLNAANWEWLNKSEVEMLFLWVEKG